MCWTPLIANKHKTRKQDMSLKVALNTIKQRKKQTNNIFLPYIHLYLNVNGHYLLHNHWDYHCLYLPYYCSYTNYAKGIAGSTVVLETTSFLITPMVSSNSSMRIKCLIYYCTHCVCALLVFVLCNQYCQFLWIVQLWLPLRYSPTFIMHHSDQSTYLLY
jgi:hypothetical protein